jgi:uncharacterized protein YyaL (SSP411 family)
VNRLAGQPSSYLASAEHQPVHWYPWGEEAFAAARAAGKPILLDIGAVWCHWCHVMDGESYEDPDLAAFLNEHFVCVKVDRDERPDVDARYQRAVQAIAGQGGWPLTAFLTPDGDVFYGGTYFPPDGKYGRPGFRSVLDRVREIFAADRDKVAATARELKSHVQSSLIEASGGVLAPELLAESAEKMARLFDFRYGGFGTQPKFPSPSAVEFLLARWWDRREPWLREIVDKTLTGMARGGVYDQVGGGFHRYSVDAYWRVPHFEKMAYDNAELLKAYAHAWAATGTPLYRDTALGIVRWVMEVLADPERGGFGASQDADVGLEDDGDYFTWTPDEAHGVLNAEEWEVARRRWDIYPQGEMHHHPEKNVLWVARTPEAIAEELKWESGRVEELLGSAKAKLKAARDGRKAPFVDRSQYTGWNAMLADAFFDAAAALDRPDVVAFGLKTCERLWDVAFVPGEGMPHRIPATRNPSSAIRASGPWLLDDQVHTAMAFLTAYEHTGDGRWLDRGRELMHMVEVFYAADDGGYFDTRATDTTGFLAARAKPIQDAPTSAPNAVAALVLLRLYALTDEESFRARAEAVLAAFAGAAHELGLHAATYLRALDWFLNGPVTVKIAEPSALEPLTSSPVSSPLSRLAQSFYRPRKAVRRMIDSPVPGTSPPVALVCAGTACAAPVREATELRTTLEGFGRIG